MDKKILDWVTLAEKFSADGDPMSMRTVAREIFDLDKNSAEGLAIMAEAAFYMGNLDEAQSPGLFMAQSLKSLLTLDVPSLTPIEAMAKLYELQQQAQKDCGQ